MQRSLACAHVPAWAAGTPAAPLPTSPICRLNSTSTTAGAPSTTRIPARTSACCAACWPCPTGRWSWASCCTASTGIRCASVRPAQPGSTVMMALRPATEVPALGCMPHFPFMLQTGGTFWQSGETERGTLMQYYRLPWLSMRRWGPGFVWACLWWRSQQTTG